METGKQPKDEGHSESNKAPKHSNKQKNKAKVTHQSRKAQNTENPNTSQDWRDCEAEIAPEWNWRG